VLSDEDASGGDLTMRSILVIDDNQEILEGLATPLRKVLEKEEVEVRIWSPADEEEDAHAAFEQRVDAETTLVVTDYDLTSGGMMGLFGSSVVAWCQQRAIPVGNYSRANFSTLPKEPDLFELRVPPNDEAVSFIATTFRGFRDINEAVKSKPELFSQRSPAAVLSQVLEAPDAENQFARYAVRLGAASGALLGKVVPGRSGGGKQGLHEKQAILSYIVGHLLLNVLAFPGPVVSKSAMNAYLAIEEIDSEDVGKLFAGARYMGPFSDFERFWWLAKVDEVLDSLSTQLPADTETETSGELHRMALEFALGRRLKCPKCSACGGQNGGYLCPFTKRTVCQRSTCSVSANSWIPQGATLCRIQREFFDEWAPILGF
jgi:CheY-like chemotaxis protein